VCGCGRRNVDNSEKAYRPKSQSPRNYVTFKFLELLGLFQQKRENLRNVHGIGVARVERASK